MSKGIEYCNVLIAKQRLKEVCANADILIHALGSQSLLKPIWLKKEL